MAHQLKEVKQYCRGLPAEYEVIDNSLGRLGSLVFWPAGSSSNKSDVWEARPCLAETEEFDSEESAMRYMRQSF